MNRIERFQKSRESLRKTILDMIEQCNRELICQTSLPSEKKEGETQNINICIQIWIE